MKPVLLRNLILFALLGVAVFAQNAEPTKDEIAEAYRSKSGGGGTLIPGTRWERWRVMDIRGWKLRFHRVGESRSPGVVTLRYEAIARNTGACAMYQVTDTIVLPPPNPQLKPVLAVRPTGSCR
jgi:hypothetical protein